VGHNGEAAPHECVPANGVSDLIFLLCALTKNNLDLQGAELILMFALPLEQIVDDSFLGTCRR